MCALVARGTARALRRELRGVLPGAASEAVRCLFWIDSACVCTLVRVGWVGCGLSACLHLEPELGPIGQGALSIGLPEVCFPGAAAEAVWCLF